MSADEQNAGLQKATNVLAGFLNADLDALAAELGLAATRTPRNAASAVTTAATLEAK